MVEHVGTPRPIRENSRIAKISFVLPGKIPLTMRPNESSHVSVVDHPEAIYPRNCYYCMCIDKRFPTLQGWWAKWTNIELYPNSLELLREIYPDCAVDSNLDILDTTITMIRLSRKPLPLLWSSMTKLLIPHYYRLLVHKHS